MNLKATILVLVIFVSLSFAYVGLTHHVVSETRGGVATPNEARIDLEKPISLDELVQRNAPTKEIAAALTRYEEFQREIVTLQATRRPLPRTRKRIPLA